MIATLVQPTIAAAVESLLERGFVVLPSLLDDADRRLASSLLDGIVERERPGGFAGFGIGIHPLCTRERRLCRYFAHPAVIAICAAALEDEVWLRHTGARIADAEHRGGERAIGWHNHAYAPDEREIPPGDSRRGRRPERLLFGFYLDGSSPEVGPLVALPRRFDDPLAPPSSDKLGIWPGEERILMPPGSACIFTTDLWHTADAGTGSGRRHLMGAHVQGRRNRRAHPEDQVQEGSEIAAGMAESPAFARLLRP